MFCQGFTLVIYPIEIDGTAEVPNGTNHLKYLLTHDIPFKKQSDMPSYGGYDLLVNLINDLTIKRLKINLGRCLRSMPKPFADRCDRKSLLFGNSRPAMAGNIGSQYKRQVQSPAQPFE